MTSEDGERHFFFGLGIVAGIVIAAIFSLIVEGICQ